MAQALLGIGLISEPLVGQLIARGRPSTARRATREHSHKNDSRFGESVQTARYDFNDPLN